MNDAYYPLTNENDPTPALIAEILALYILKPKPEEYA